MSKKRHFTSKLLGIGLISPTLHYGIFAQDWWKTISLNLKDKNIVFTIPFHLYMHLENISSKIEPYPSTAINLYYKEVFGTKTEYSGIGVIGFENEKIIQKLLDKIEFFLIFLQIEKLSVVILGLGYSSKDGYYGAGEEIYCNADKIEQFTRSMPDDIWKKVGIHKKFSESHLFRITHKTTQNLLQSEVIDEWNTNYEKLTNILIKIYPENYKLQDKKLRAWYTMFKTCGCSNIILFSHEESQIEF
ncbi:hypothetical protein C1646_764782 [Rhizophagus diaphanus]|nr:hypothetical protein C1646_764782 [Rhizophagus diaphanus] [Rhizophagus sp. MUCL 43196]